MSARKNYYDYLKRGIDIVGSGVGLVVLAPVIGAVGLAVRSKLGSPVIFKQQRPGKDGKIFTLYKFRSMLDVDESQGLHSDEERLTSFGLKLRSLSLDEMPSLVNVLKGEMSLVGPRPLRVHYLKRYNPRQQKRHEVRPGVTGLAQVNGRNAIDWSSKLELDVRYVEARGLCLDAKILWRTLQTVTDRSGISAENHVTTPEFLGELYG